MAMNLTAGDLYFINEQDVRNGSRSSYYKIGIVRDSKGRDSKDRLLEHQTGNPRKLCIVETLTMPAVEAIETNLHYLFARNRVLGEWMDFTPAELQKAIQTAKNLKLEMEANLPDFEAADRLKDVISTGSKLASTEKAANWYAVINNFKEIIDACNEAENGYRDYLTGAIEEGVDVSGLVTVQTRTGAKKFDEKLFAEKYPEIYARFTSESKSTSGSFLIASAKDWNSDVSTIGTEQIDVISNFSAQIATADFSLDTGFALHEQHLALLEVLKYAEWQSDLAKVKLKVLTGESDGIEGICTWKRKEKISISLDKAALKQNHPEEYASCESVGKDIQAFVVEPKAGVRK